MCVAVCGKSLTYSELQRSLFDAIVEENKNA